MVIFLTPFLIVIVSFGFSELTYNLVENSLFEEQLEPFPEAIDSS